MQLKNECIKGNASFSSQSNETNGSKKYSISYQNTITLSLIKSINGIVFLVRLRFLKKLNEGINE
jgi:hypothetical protein